MSAPLVPPTPVARPTPPPPKRRSWRRTFRIALTIVVLAAAVGGALWGWIALQYVYASGQHTGYVRKLAKTGWLCKTWEGELVTSPTPAAPARLFAFTVRDDSLAKVIQGMTERPVTLDYAQHLALPSQCFGETEYFIVGAKVSP